MLNEEEIYDLKYIYEGRLSSAQEALTKIMSIESAKHHVEVASESDVVLQKVIKKHDKNTLIRTIDNYKAKLEIIKKILGEK